MPAHTSHSAVKVVGRNGQISLGKQYAGRQVLMEEYEPGVWLVRTATVVPDNERWLLNEQTTNALDEALDWAQYHPASDDTADVLLKRLRDDSVRS
jgi:hypothetical protein